MRKSLIILAATVSLLTACGETTNSSGEESGDTATTVATATENGESEDNADDATTDDDAADGTTTTAADTTTTLAATTDETTLDDAATTVPAATSDSSPTTTSTTVLASGSGSSDRVRLIDALDKTGEFTSARMEGWLTIVGGTGRAAGTAETMNFSAAYDTTTQMSMSLIDFSQFAAGMPGTPSLTPESADTIGELEIRTIGDTAYLRLGLLASFGFPTPWVSMPAADVSDVADGFGVNTADPRGMLGIFALAEGEVVTIGNEQVRGVDATHFRIIADVDKLLAFAAPDAADRLRNTQGFPREGSLPIDMWIGDDDGFVHRFSYTVDGTTDPESDFESMELGWEIYDYGVSIDFAAPPADQVTDGGALLALALGS